MSLLLQSRFQEDRDIVLSSDVFLRIQQVCTGLIIGGYWTIKLIDTLQMGTVKSENIDRGRRNG